MRFKLAVFVILFFILGLSLSVDAADPYASVTINGSPTDLPFFAWRGGWDIFPAHAISTPDYRVTVGANLNYDPHMIYYITAENLADHDLSVNFNFGIPISISDAPHYPIERLEIANLLYGNVIDATGNGVTVSPNPLTTIQQCYLNDVDYLDIGGALNGGPFSIHSYTNYFPSPPLPIDNFWKINIGFNITGNGDKIWLTSINGIYAPIPSSLPLAASGLLVLMAMGGWRKIIF